MDYKNSPDMQLLCNEEKFKEMQRKYNPNNDALTPSHPFITKFLQPLLQRLSDEITQDRNKSSKTHTSVSVVIHYRSLHLTSSHSFKTSLFRKPQTVIDYDPTLPGANVASSIRHESEHANQTTGKGYSILERSLVQLARMHYSTNDVPYKNNYNEMRARIAEAQLHLARFEELSQLPGDHYDERIQFSNELIRYKQHLTEHVHVDATKKWIEECKKAIESHRPDKQLLKAFPDAHSKYEAKQAALRFLDEDAPQMLADCVQQVYALAAEMQGIIVQISQEREVHEQQEVKNRFTAIAKELNIPVLEAAPPSDVKKYPLNKGAAEYWVRDHYQDKDKFNFAIAKDPKYGWCLIYDDNDVVYRDYAHPRPPELTPQSSTPDNHLDLEALFEYADTEYVAPDPNHIEQDVDVR